MFLKNKQRITYVLLILFLLTSCSETEKEERFEIVSEGIIENFNMPNRIIKTSDGNFVISGLIMNTDSIYRRGFMKLDCNGNEIWRSFTNQALYTSTVSETEAGDLLISAGSEFFSNSFLAKYDENGVLLWEIDSCGVYGQYPKVIESNLEEVILLERSLTYPYEELKIIKYDKDGSKIWEKELVATSTNGTTEYKVKYVYDIAVFGDDNKIAIIYNSTDGDLILLFLNPEGEQIYYRDYNYNTSFSSRPSLFIDESSYKGSPYINIIGLNDVTYNNSFPFLIGYYYEGNNSGITYLNTTDYFHFRSSKKLSDNGYLSLHFLLPKNSLRILHMHFAKLIILALSIIFSTSSYGMINCSVFIGCCTGTTRKNEFFGDPL